MKWKLSTLRLKCFVYFGFGYQTFNKDVLGSLENSSKEWLIAWFEKEKLLGYAALLRHGMQEVCALELLGEFKIALAPGLYERLMNAAATGAPPYIPIAGYIRRRQPKGPFCLPLHEWMQEETQIDAEDYISKEYYNYDMAKILSSVRCWC